MYFDLIVNGIKIGTFKFDTIVAILKDTWESPPQCWPAPWLEDYESNTILLTPNLMH